jgi:hypothetical protein
MTVTEATRPTVDDDSPAVALHKLAAETLDILGEDIEELPTRLRWLFRKERERWFDVLVDWAAEELARHEILRARQGRGGVGRPGKDRGLASLKSEWDRKYEACAKFPLSDGTFLMDASRDQVSAQERVYRAQGTTVMARADWLAGVLAKMGKAQRVAEAMDAKALYELRAAAEEKWGAQSD